MNFIGSKYKAPLCKECGHVMRFARKKNLWDCTWCEFSCDSLTAKGLYPPEVPDTYDISELAIFSRNRTPVDTATASQAITTPTPVSATPICEAPIAVPISVPVVDVVDVVAAVDVVDVVDVDFSTIEPVTASAPFDNNFLDEIFANKDSPAQPHARYDTDNHPKMAFFSRVKASPDFKPVPAELAGFTGLTQKFNLRGEK